ncbi:MAG: hypothetical protein QG641_2576, partial [Candidatus Poribacteria bacterium]|nr:hypothetical protein [Candidatus Poribacteria bacterium]
MNRYIAIFVLMFISIITQVFALPIETIKLPQGFEISVYAEGVLGARSMNLSPNGILFVGSRGTGNVYAMVDNDKDNKADEIITVANGLHSPNGVAFRD